jgi:hypothetical protein
MNKALPKHGYIGCRSCYPSHGNIYTFSNADGSRWRIEEPNAAWGSSNPEVLVLGFSRGGNQSKPGLAFDAIAFKGMRTQLGKILAALAIVKSGALDQRIRAFEKYLAFGSLIRCSVSQWDEATKNFSKSGNSILQRFAKGDVTSQIAEQCAKNYLLNLPETTRLVVMLGNEEKYIRFCHVLVKKTRGEARWVKSVSYDSKGIRFVHVIHPKAQGRLIPDWLAGQGSQIAKKEDATLAVQELQLLPT